MRLVATSMMKRIAAVSGLLLLFGCGDAEETKGQGKPVARPVKVFVVQATSSGFERSYPAVVLASEEVQLSFRVAGRIVALPVRAATVVKQGDVLAQLDKRDFELQLRRLESQISEANAELRLMVAGARPEQIKALEANVAAAQARVVAARDTFKRTQELHRRGIVPNAKRDADRRDLQIAEAELRASQQKLTEAKAGAREDEVAQQKAKIKGLNAELDKAKAALSDTTLRAPFSGIIAKRLVDNFSNVKADEAVFLLQKLESVDLTFDIPGPDLVVLTRRQAVTTRAHMDSIPDRSFAVTLAEATTQADPRTQTYRIRVRLKKTGGATILPGMTGRIVMTAKSSAKREFRVPAPAIAADPDGKSFVWVVSKPANTVSKRPVKTAGASGDTIIVAEGLEAGDVIVSAGVSQLQEKMTVRPMAPVSD